MEHWNMSISKRHAGSGTRQGVAGVSGEKATGDLPVENESCPRLKPVDPKTLTRPLNLILPHIGGRKLPDMKTLPDSLRVIPGQRAKRDS